MTTGKRNPQGALTVSEVAALLNVHTNTVRNWCESGILRSYRLGPRRDRRVESKDVLDMIAGR